MYNKNKGKKSSITTKTSNYENYNQSTHKSKNIMPTVQGTCSLYRNYVSKTLHVFLCISLYLKIYIPIPTQKLQRTEI